MDDDVERYSAAVHRRDAARIARLVIVAAVILGVAALALDNRTDTRVGYVWDEATAPLWVVIVASALVGVVVGWLVAFRSRRR